MTKQKPVSYEVLRQRLLLKIGITALFQNVAATVVGWALPKQTPDQVKFVGDIRQSLARAAADFERFRQLPQSEQIAKVQACLSGIEERFTPLRLAQDEDIGARRGMYVLLVHTVATMAYREPYLTRKLTEAGLNADEVLTASDTTEKMLARNSALNRVRDGDYVRNLVGLLKRPHRHSETKKTEPYILTRHENMRAVIQALQPMYEVPAIKAAAPLLQQAQQQQQPQAQHDATAPLRNDVAGCYCPLPRRDWNVG